MMSSLFIWLLTMFEFDLGDHLHIPSAIEIVIALSLESLIIVLLRHCPWNHALTHCTKSNSVHLSSDKGEAQLPPDES